MLWSFACDLECALTGLGERGNNNFLRHAVVFFLRLPQGLRAKKRSRNWSSEQGHFVCRLLLSHYLSQTRPPILFHFEIALM